MLYPVSRNVIVFSQETGDSGLNLSVSGAVAEDVPGMVKRIISMVQRVPGWETKWKMISILIGHNDLCSKSCVTTWQRLGITNRVRVEPQDYERNIRKSDNLLLTSKMLVQTSSIDLIITCLPLSAIISLY